MLQILILCAWIFAAGCVGPLYKVAPLPPAPPADASTATSTAGFELTAAVLHEEEAYARFSANLHLAGVIAIDAMLVNNSSGPIALSSARVQLSDASGRRFKPIEPKKALSRVMKYYGVRLYGREAHRRTREAYETLALQTREDLGPGQQRRGMLYFEAKPPLADYSGLVLALAGRGVYVKLPLR